MRSDAEFAGLLLEQVLGQMREQVDPPLIHQPKRAPVDVGTLRVTL